MPERVSLSVYRTLSDILQAAITISWGASAGSASGRHCADGICYLGPSMPQNEDIVKWALVLQWSVMSMCVSRLLFSWEVHQDGRL
jgi:hypothetical protein